MRLHRWVLLLLILLAFGRGVWALGGKSFWWDESLSLLRARQDVAGVLSNQTVLTDNTQQLVTVDNHPPLYFLLLWATVRLAGQTEFALRFPSLAFATLIVPLLFVVGRRLLGRAAGLAAAGLGAVSPMYLWYSQEARGYTMVAFLSLLSFYLFLRAFQIDRPTQAAKQPATTRVVLYIVTSVALVVTHYLGALLIAFELLILVVTLARRRSGRRAAIVTIAILLAAMAVPLAYVWLNRPAATAKVGFRYIPLLPLLRDLLNSFSLGLSVNVAQWPVLALDLLFLALLVAGLIWLLRRRSSPGRRRSAWLLAGYLLVPVLATYVLSYVRPVYMNSRHLILVSPAFYLLVGAGIAALGYPLAAFRRERISGSADQRMSGSANQRISESVDRPAGQQSRIRHYPFGPRIVLPLVCLLLLSGVGYSSYNYYGNPEYDKDHHREWGAYLREHVRPGDVVIVDPPCIAELYDYYGSTDAPWIGLPLLSGPRQQTVDKLMEVLGSYDRVWLAFSHTPPWCDPRRFPEKWLNQNAFRVDYQQFESYASIILVAAYVRSRPDVPNLPNGSHSLDVRYSSALRLAGYRPVSAATAGQPLHVQLFWGVDAPIEHGASVALRLVDADGHVWGQGEQCPFNDLYPMRQWQPGTTLQDEHQFTIQPGTPPGQYELEATLVSRPSETGCLGERGPAIPPMAGAGARGDRVLLGLVEVGRAPQAPSVADLAIEHTRRVSVGSGLVLLGEQVLPGNVRPGDAVDVTLYWQAQHSALPDAHLRLRLIDPSGTVRQEKSIRPAGDSYPASLWQAGDRFKGQFRLWLPEDALPGQYTVALAPESNSASAAPAAGLVATARRWLSCIAGRCDPPAAVRLGRVEVAVTGQQGASPLPSRPDVPAAHPVDVTLGAQVRLLGYDLGAASVEAGGSISLTLYWQGLRPIALSYHVFNHLLGPSGETVAQKDGVPRDDSYPTSLWQPGEVIVDRYEIAIDPATAPGSYLLESGMYRLETLKRLPMVDATGRPLADDRLVLGRIEVLPAPTPLPAPPLHRRYLPVVTKN